MGWTNRDAGDARTHRSRAPACGLPRSAAGPRHAGRPCARTRRRLDRALMLIAALVTGAATAAPVVLAPFSGAPPGAPPDPWRLVPLPKIACHTSFSLGDRDGSRVLQVEANGSYANLLHRVDGDLAAAPTLSWRWRVDVLSAQTHITRKGV